METSLTGYAEKMAEKHNEPVDNVNPKHYTEMAISPLEYIKANNLEWNVGNTIKYISRYKMKNGLEDLLKSHWYLSDLIKDEYGKLSETEKEKYSEKVCEMLNI